jgi:acyl carrier protein
VERKTDVAEQVVELLIQYSVQTLDSVDENYNFVTSGLLDSFSLLSFITDVEEQFQIAFTPDELTSELMQTISGLSAAVSRKIISQG